MPSHSLKDWTHQGHIQDADQWRQEGTTDTGPEGSMLLRKAAGTWLTSGLLHIPLMGSPADFPVCIFSLMAVIYVSCQNPLEKSLRLFSGLQSI